MEIIILDGARMPDREATHRYLAETMRLPAWYGCNLDALADCLGQFGRCVLIVLVNSAAVTEAMGEYGRRMIEVFQEISAQPEAFTFTMT